MLLQVMFLAEFGLVMDTRIRISQGIKNLVTCLKCDDIFFI